MHSEADALFFFRWSDLNLAALVIFLLSIPHNLLIRDLRALCIFHFELLQSRAQKLLDKCWKCPEFLIQVNH